MFRKNVACHPLKKLSSWRKISLATWRTPQDPSVYGSLDVRARQALEMIEKIRAQTGKKVTITHLVIKAVALTLAKYPELNVLIRRKKIYLRERVDIFVQVFLHEQGKPDLSGTKIEGADKKSVLEIAAELEQKASTIREGKDKELKPTKSMLKILPTGVLAGMLRVLGYLTYDLNLNLSRFGIQQDPFGAAMVTSVGMFGIRHGYAPLVPFSRTPMLFAVGVVENTPVVENGQVVAEPVLHIGGTIDHRIIDGYLGGLASKMIKEILENPWQHLAPHGM